MYASSDTSDGALGQIPANFRYANFRIFVSSSSFHGVDCEEILFSSDANKVVYAAKQFDVVN